MGFQLGRAIGKLASSAISTATRGLVRPNFQKPSAARPPSGGTPSIISTVPDSTVTTTRSGAFAGNVGFGTTQRQVQYFNPPGISNYPVNDGGGGAMTVYQKTRACHLNKSTYVTRGGGTSRWPQQLVVHPKGTECVTRRRLNPGNGRAALRAVRRLTAFYSLSQRVAKQLRKAASKAHIGGRRGRRSLPRSAGVEVVNVD